MQLQIERRLLASPRCWPQVNEWDRVRFVIGGGLHFATAAAALGALLCVAFVAQSAQAEGKTLDFTWFQQAGRAGAPAMPILQTFRAVLPIAFLLPVCLWIHSLGRAVEAETNPDPATRRLSALRRLSLSMNGHERRWLYKMAESIGHVATGILISLVIYGLVSSAAASRRVAPQFEIALDALVVAALVGWAVALLLERADHLMRTLTAR